MFKSKLEVDKHVDNCLKKINNETERNLKGFAFAKLYFSVGDYEQARRYVSSYLNVKPKSAEGYHLLGKCLEKLNKKDPALEAYKNSLKLEPKQNSIVLKVCELLSSEDVDMDHTEARYFCELAQSLDPNNSSVYRLKERLITTQSGDPVEISKLLLKELENRPKDVNLRVRLIKHLLQHNLIKEAYKHASTIEEKNLSFFHNNLSWYEIVAEVLLRFQRNASTEVTWEFWLLSVSVLNRLAALSLDEHIESGKTTSEYIAAVFNFDQMLTKASQNVNSCPDRQLISIFLNHYFGQLNLHLSTLAYKQAKCDLLSFKDISNMVIPLLLASYHTNPPDLQSVWYTHTSEKNKNLVRHWHKEASYRCSQAGHILLAAVKNRKSFFIEKATQYSTGMWREQLFKKLFVKRDHHLNMSTSYFVSNLLSEEPVFKLPDPEQLLRYDEVAQLAYPESLHHYIWIALNNSLSDMQAKAFEGLQYSVKNFNNCSAESLSLLDVQAFLYCATLCAKSKTDDKKTLVYYNREKPKVLHASITESLGTLNQSKFLKLAYKMYKNEPDSGMSGIRLSLIHGIEVVRCVGHHGLDVQLLVKLAEIFEERAKKVSKQSEIEHNIARADLYWRTALPLLEKIKNNQFVTYAVNRLFEYKPKEMSISEAISHIEKGKLFSAVQLMKKKEYEKSIQVFEQLKDPYASFYQSQIYKHMADHKMSDNKENVTSEMRSQHIILLSKARDCLYLTLDRLREPSVDRSHPLNAQLGTEIEKMERLLSRVDPDCTNRNECDGMSDENPSSENSVGEQYLSTYTHASFHNSNHFTPKHETHNHSTPLRLNITRQEARPSPERLDAQIRQIAASRDAVFSNIVEQNRLIVDTHRSLLEELRGFKDAINNLTTMVDELKAMKSGFEQIKNIEKSVEEIKNSFDLSNLVDSIQEMKKELSELKKEHNKTNQLSDDDLHFLDSDYAVDYNINSNMGYNPSIPNIYAGYQPGRLQNANPLAAYHGLYPGLYPGFYGPLAIPPTGAIPFTPDQQNIGISATAAYPPPTLTNPSLPALSTSSMGVGMLTGQSLSQTINASPKPLHANNLTPVAATTASFIPPNKALPVNVVITSSDPLPTNVVTSQPILSVTIPPQHIKSNIPKTQQPHNYQIPLPISSVTQIMTTPSILSKPPPAITTQSILSNVAPPIFSAIQPNKGISDKELNTTQNSEMNDTLNKSNVSSGSIEHDPCPDFKPIIPLPDEVPVNTGEEGETELFCEHAKLFRHVNTNGTKEWKERGIGLLKILQNPESGKIRILMRRDQIHKICANHFLTSEMTLTPMTKNDRAYIWAAHDFADEVVVVEKFCVQFKTAEQAKSFYEAFMKAKEKLNVVKIDSKQADTPKAFTTQSSATFGGFVFTSPPTFKPKESVTVATPEIQETPKSGPFSNFSFSKSNNLFKTPTEATTFSPLVLQQSSSPHKNDEDESHEEDFVPTAEFKPVVALPELIEVKTGEEDLEVLFENRCKLFRYDGDSKEWKERGLGNIRVLKGEDIRILMRREQVHKVCCNHTVLKNMMFSFKDNANKAIVWTAQDFSEGVLKTERFTARFKTEEQAAQFIKVLQTAQTSMDENNKVVNSKHHKPETRPRTTSLSEKFKPVKGSWECKNCYIINEGKVSFCVACETPKSGTTPKKTEESGSVFSFGNFNNKSDSTKPSAGSVFSQNTVTSSWGNAFKPAEGSWECKACFVRNNSDKDMCISCQSPREGTAEKKGTSGINLETPGLKFSFGIPATTTTDKAKITAPSSFGVSFKAEGGAKPEEVKTGLSLGFGGAFNPEPGSWECKECLVRNKPDAVHCVSCTNPKDSSIPKKDTSKGIDLETPGLKFNFGMPASGSAAPPLGTSVVTTIGNSATPTNTLDSTTKTDKSDKSLSSKVPQDMKFVFGSPQKHDFEFKPKSPRRISCGQGEDESDGNYTEEEEDNIYFKPVIPLPDKVEVKTGEEEEDVLYCHRAKLFRFVNSEWKERGLGDIKILKRKDNGKLRVVMRRELVLKICLNHNLTDSIEYIKKDDKSWLFHVADYSEGEIVHEQFCLRFKSLEIAKQFREAVTDALKSGSDNIKAASTTVGESSEDEIEIISETKVTPEEEKEALALGLPAKFFSYRQLPDCTCDQCQKDDEYLKDLFKTDKTSSESNKIDTPSSARFIFGRNTPPSTGFSFTPQSQNKISSTEVSSSSTITFSSAPTAFTFTPQNQTKSESLREILMKPSILATGVGAKDTLSSNEKDEKTKDSTPLNSFSFTNAFSPSTPQTTTPSIFNKNPGGLFSNSGTNIFSSPTPTNFFGSKPTTGGNIFGNTSDSSELTRSNIFNVSANNSGSIFGGSNFFQPNNSTAPTFGSNAFTNTDTKLNESANSAKTSVFGNSFNRPAVETGSTSVTIISNKDSHQLGTTNLKEDDEVVLKCNSDISFATLASTTNPDAKPAFTKIGDSSFSFLGAGAPVFKSASKENRNKTSKANKSKTESDDDEAAGEPTEEEYDPHYEPIVPLPEAIVVTTGEEDETPLFNERAKLYRYDNDSKEWKERGVGQLKILHHREKQTYRLLLRREQVHKVVLNQLIIHSLQLNPMLSSDKSWVWVGYNYTDEGCELEKLAVRFRSTETAQQFQVIFQNCVDQLVEIQQNKSVPSTVQNYGLEDVSSDEQNTLDDTNNEDYEDEEEDEDGRSIMFLKRCQLQSQLPDGTWDFVVDGIIQIYYDPELYASRIEANDDSGQVVSKTSIGVNTVMDIDKNECTWKAVEWADGDHRWRVLKAIFSDEKDAEEFHANYIESLNYAHQLGVVDEIVLDTENED